MYVLSAGKREVHLIIGIVVAILVVALIVGLALFYYRYKKERKRIEMKNREQVAVSQMEVRGREIKTTAV